MPGSSVAIGAGSATAATEEAAAAAGNTEIRFEPGTRVVIDGALPVSGGGISAQWYRTVTSRSSAAGVTTELAELKCFIDITGADHTGGNQTIGVDGGGPAGLGRNTAGQFGTVLSGNMRCLEVPNTRADIDLFMETVTLPAGALPTVDAVYLAAPGGDWTAGQAIQIPVDTLVTDGYFLLRSGAGVPVVFGAGKFLLTFLCQYTVPYPA